MAVPEPSIEHLERLHTNFLFAIPSFYSNTNTDEKQKLLDLFSVIFEEEYFKANLAWFVVWDKSISEEYPKQCFLSGDNHRACQIVNMYRTQQWEQLFSKYVTIPSQFCVKNSIEDTSFIFTTEDFAVKRVSNKYLVSLNLKDIVSEITINDNYEKANRSLEEEVIGKLADSHSKLKDKDTLVTPIYNTLKILLRSDSLRRDDIIKLLNCCFWLRLAYPEDWKTMLYFPGIIAKKVESVPFGVNIGFKKTPSMDVILFLKKITLLFFTRKSVDFFQKKAEKETGRRRKDVNNLNDLLSDFQHIFLQCAADSSNWAAEEGKYEIIRDINNYMKGRGEYIKLLSDFIFGVNKDTESFYGYPLSSIFPPLHMFMSPVFFKLHKFELSWSDVSSQLLSFFSVLVHKNSKIINVSSFDIKKIDNYIKGMKVSLPHPISVASILENLIHNALLKHCNSNLLRADSNQRIKICILLSESQDKFILGFWDTGEGFDETSWKEIPQWREKGSSDNGEKNKGFGYWFIDRIVRHIDGDFDYGVYDNENRLHKQCEALNKIIEHIDIIEAFALKQLASDKFRVVHIISLMKSEGN